MFLLDRPSFRGADMSRLSAFVMCWERYYKDAVTLSPSDKRLIDYFAELNVSGDLTEQNVIRLLRWKDRQRLTHPKVTAGGTAPNPRVTGVLSKLGMLNRFRRGEIDAKEFEESVKTIFRSGIVWKLFLFHIARPWDWPIADQHVFRAYVALFAGQKPSTIAEFEQYRSCFFRLAMKFGEQNSLNTHGRGLRTCLNKRLDNALMAYGQFLLAYDR
jgi:hypothetical protein